MDTTHAPGLTWRGRAVAMLSCTLLMLVPGLVMAPSASADSICSRLGYGANCRIDFGNPGNSGSGGGGSGRPPCNLGPAEYRGVACSTDAGLWSNEWQCYVLPMSPQPTANDPEWADEIESGATIYECTPHEGGDDDDDDNGGGGEIELRAHIGPTPTVIGNSEDERRDLLQTALAMRFEALFIGMAPTPDLIAGQPRGSGNRMGIVGMPVWMWARETPFTPWEVTTTDFDDGDYWARAKVVHTTWDMGDGSGQIRCTREQMKEYHTWMADRTPECGHTYTKPGRYHINMWTTFRVTWNDVNGEGGEFITIRRSMYARIGESQVVNQ